MDVNQATPQELMDELRRRGFDPTALSLANINELGSELKTRGIAFVSGIFVIDEDTVAAGDAGKIGVLHDGDPVTQMRLACRVFHDVGYDLMQDKHMTIDTLKAIVSQELGDMFEFEGDDRDDDLEIDEDSDDLGF